MLNQRKKELLEAIIKEYIKTAQPVGSGLVVDKYKFGLSPATIRNEMAALLADGYISQPHTSAGRVPTEKAYKFFAGSLSVKKIKPFVLPEEFARLADEDVRFAIKQLAKLAAEFTGEAVFAAFGKNDFYYTGISNLFSKPEFSSPEIIVNISAVIDAMDEAIGGIFGKFENLESASAVGGGIKVLIGSDNPFSPQCSVILARWSSKGAEGLIGILGPLRMDYEKNLGAVKELEILLK